MNTIGKFAAAALLTLSGMSLALPAHAIPALRLTATGTVSATQTITDNDANDANASDGIVAYSGAVGDFSFTSSVGVTKPVLGTSVVPKMDIL